MTYVLLVEDDPSVRRGLARLLERHGHEVREAATGREAMKLFEQSPPAVVVTDINMPEMDGIEVIIALRRAAERIPIVAVSAGGLMPKELLLDNAALLGAIATLAKPIDPERLLAAVDRAIAGGEE